MRTVAIVFFGLVASSGCACAQYGGYGTGSNPNSVYHQGYETRNGTYTEPHYQTAPNDSRFDNYETRGNVNPYTGETGHRSPY